MFSTIALKQQSNFIELAESCMGFVSNYSGAMLGGV